MRSRIAFCMVITLAVGVSCNTTPAGRQAATISFEQPVIKKLYTGNEFLTKDLVDLKIIDTLSMGPLSENSYCETAIQLNDSISYTIISLSDTEGLCSYFALVSFDNQKGKFIASRFLHSDCDIDYAMDSYKLYQHSIVAKDKINVITTIVIQKKDRTAANEEESIAEKKEYKTTFTISEDGGITDSEREVLKAQD